jgi:hypothetical protein
MKNEHKATAVLMAFATGIFLAMLIGGIFKTETIQSIDDAKRIYALIALTGSATFFFAVFTLIEYEASNTNQ